jgi:predicted RNase H-like nuclease
MMRSVLGIDAAWTERQPSGIALIADEGSGWRLLDAAASYEAFLREETGAPSARHQGSIPHAARLISKASRKAGAPLDLVAIDMPLSMKRIDGRRASDNMISTLYGARHASTHTPSVERPGRLSDDLRMAFDLAGYPLAVSALTGPALIEVYPHPALIELAAADRRLPYKFAKAGKYWPGTTPPDRRLKLLRTWEQILDLLVREIKGVKDRLRPPAQEARGHEMKAFEDTLDAVVCAWVGACALDGKAAFYGDDASAIWVPLPRPSLYPARSSRPPDASPV